jgi:predicted metal-dependent hydrolase
MNLALVYMPVGCIDYVALHEVLHFRNKKHDKKYYEDLSMYMPDWKERKKILDGVIVRDLLMSDASCRI